MDAVVKIENLTVVLGGYLRAIDGIDLELSGGRTIGIIGPSGAGKTTLIRAIVGNLKVTSGRVTVLGSPAGAKVLRKQVNYMTQSLSVYPDLTVKENLDYFITMAGQPKEERANIAAEVLGLVDMASKSNTLVRELSGGQLQRVSLAIALIGSPRLMVLDEPTVGLDPVLRNNLWGLFNKLAKQGTTLIISSHSMDEASRCDDLVLIRDGNLVAHGSPKDILRQTESKTVEEGFLKLVGAVK